jgi:hypothetical protein
MQTSVWAATTCRALPHRCHKTLLPRIWQPGQDTNLQSPAWQRFPSPTWMFPALWRGLPLWTPSRRRRGLWRRGRRPP